jgi:hypothetical protein
VAVIAVLVLSMALPSNVAAQSSVTAGGGMVEPTAASVSTVTSTAAAQPTISPAPSAGKASPHPGTLEIYEVAPSGQTSEDPSVAYDSVSEEPILNVYQTLVAYNGSSTSTFLPELSTCVPGAKNGVLSTPSVSCQALYGQTLIKDNSAGEPRYWTFPIDPAARFYDEATGASWPVFPSDVMFTFARTMGFADLPGPYVLNGWIVSQSLLSVGNPAWDGGIHYPFNNTPQGILGSMLVNDSAYCPAPALAQSGCITFDAFGEGNDWPFFEELVADVLGSGVEPCGWYTAQGASVPGFNGTTAAHGDGPCWLPGASTSTRQAGFQDYLKKTGPTAWDAFELLADNHPAVQPGVQFNAVGSGPYFLAADNQTTGYTLQASPAYHQPTGCMRAGGGCDPAIGSYIKQVVVTYESSDTIGIEEYVAGQADQAQILQPETSTLVSLKDNGTIGVLQFPTLETFFLPYDLDFNVAGEQSIDPNSAALNVPSDFFASNAVRDLLNHAWAYSTVLNKVWTTDGIRWLTNEGGAIPIGMGSYYPNNISWPYLGGNPGTNTSVNSAAWWWTQGTNSSSPYYDPELAACTHSTPCRFPIIGEQGNHWLDTAIADFIPQIERITGNALLPYSFDLSFYDLVIYSAQSPGNNPMPFFNLGWAPDYPDPTDYMAAMYYANGTYTLGDATYQALENTSHTQYWGASCGHDSGSWSDLVYWANYASTQSGPIPSSCQGPAYGAMLTWMANAAPLPVGSYRTLIYNEVEHIENQLGLYLWYSQANQVESYASWINPATVNTNPIIGGSGDQTWYQWGYVSPKYAVTFEETGLPHGKRWSVAFDGTPKSTAGTSITFAVTNGSYTYLIAGPSGFIVSGLAPEGILGVSGSTLTQPVTFLRGATYSLTFREVGLPNGTSWCVTLGAKVCTTGNDLVFKNLTNGTYSFQVATVPGFTAKPASGKPTIAGASVKITVKFT